MDDEGFLEFTGRIKEIFKTSGGKYVAPNQIEAKFKALCPYATKFVVFGAERNFAVALIALDPDAIVTWAEERGLGGVRPTPTSSPPLRRSGMVGGFVEQLNGQLNRWETMKVGDPRPRPEHRVRRADPSLKVKRAVVEKNNKDLIDSFYG